MKWLLLFLPTLLFSEKIPLFTPPPKWEIADPKMLGKQIEIGFVTKGKKGLCPSINLASEQTDLTLSEYLQVLRPLHAKKGPLRDLGSFSTIGGVGHLIQLDTPSKFGTVRLIQFVAIWEGKAYALTAAAAKEEFPKHLPAFEKAIKSLTTVNDLADILGEKKLQSTIAAWKKSAGDIKSRKAIEKFALKDCAEYGTHFQVLLLKQLAKEDGS